MFRYNSMRCLVAGVFVLCLPTLGCSSDGARDEQDGSVHDQVGDAGFDSSELDLVDAVEPDLVRNDLTDAAQSDLKPDSGPDLQLPDGLVSDELNEAHDSVPEEDVVTVDEKIAGKPEPSCEECHIVAVETWDGESELNFPIQAVYDQEYEGLMYRFRPWLRFRMPHPGKVQTLWFYSQGAGEIRVQLSTGFPGGHYPCLDETTGADMYPVGKPFWLTTTETSGWREIDVSGHDWQVGGFDEFMVLFELTGDARVGLAAPKVPAPGDYAVNGGLIADAPGDQMTCFPTMSTFTDGNDAPLLWVVRAEIEAEVELSPRWFVDAGAAGPGVGGQVAFGDFDNDLDDDLLAGGRLWQNDGYGGFVDVTEAAGLAGLGGETVWGDYDNDGFRDILAVGSVARLFRNNADGTFTEVTEVSGISIDANSQGVAWLDVNQDGFLDFYAASYGTLADSEIAERDYVFINNGDGTFYDFTEASGIPLSGQVYHGRGVCVADYDKDGDADIYVGNYRLDPNQLWQNQGGLEGFLNVGYPSGTLGWFEFGGGYGHTIGPSFGDLNGDGWFDILVPNLAHPRFIKFSDMTTVYFNNGNGKFTGIEAPDHGIAYDETHSDATLFDLDNDGDLDAFITAVYEGRRSFVYANDGSGHYSDVTYQTGIEHYNGWGAAAADVDGDGDVDLVANRLFLNNYPEAGNVLRVRLEGGATGTPEVGVSNRDAIGAVVTVEVEGKVVVRQVEGGKGTGNQNSLVLHFGLGGASKADSLTVVWPSGKTTVLSDVSSSGIYVITEP